ncbi:Hypp2540 [Branchiostoma lanceolatum]|uniref:Hypp2540 protein n=1 Tax=Branchiostoma lanceolatum TaxID=7740 RepID=A0A8K0ESZ5_BRALA|nr:Hypp2540 [Branchiostoma lanceolatum]
MPAAQAVACRTPLRFPSTSLRNESIANYFIMRLRTANGPTPAVTPVGRVLTHATLECVPGLAGPSATHPCDITATVMTNGGTWGTADIVTLD